MAMTKTIQTRIKNRYDSLSNWLGEGVTLLPGEIALVSVTTQQIDKATGDVVNVPAVLMKVGESDGNGGSKSFDALPWVSALAADVYSWAKNPTAEEVPVTVMVGTTSTSDTLGGWIKAINDKAATSASGISALEAKVDVAKVSTAISSAISTLEEGLVHTGTKGANQIVKAVTQEDGKVTVTYGTITEEELPNISSNKIIVDGATLTSKLSTMDADIASIKETVTKGIVFRGEVTSEPSGTTYTLKGTDAAVTANVGDMVLFGEKEYVYVASGDWKELGDLSRVTTLETWRNNLQKDDAAVANQFVTEVDIAADGTVTIGRAQPTSENIKHGDDSTVSEKLGDLDAAIAGHLEGHDQYLNQNAFSNIAVDGQTTVAADSATDTVTFAGNNITITTDANTVNFSVADAAIGTKGVVSLVDSISSTSTTEAATANAVKTAYDKGAEASAAAAAIAENYVKISGDSLVDQDGLVIIFDCGGAPV